MAFLLRPTHPAKSATKLILLVAACLTLDSYPAAGAMPPKTVHTVFTTECNTYFNWQSLGIYHSHSKAKQPGPITRLLSCTPEQLKTYPDLDDIPTHIAPSWTNHPRTGDVYSGINKPVAVLDWLEKVKPPEDYILIIDSDTIMREPFDVDELQIRPGWAVSGFYGYLKGVNNELALKHIPDVPPRNDTLAGPYGRRSDQVGGFTFMHKEDLRRMTPGWVSITEDVRADPDAWKLSGDVFTKQPGDKPWIAEMYGYSYGAAKADVWHHTNDRVMIYPGYLPLGLQEPPMVLHYGIKFEVPGLDYAFDKHWYQRFDPLLCPPWERTDAEGRPVGGLFPNPPHPSLLSTTGLELLRDLLAIETIATVNEALCLRHTKACQPSQELNQRCHEVFELSKDLAARLEEVTQQAPDPHNCRDDREECKDWAARGECQKNQGYMLHNCALSCGVCDPETGEVAKDAPEVKGERVEVTRADGKQIQSSTELRVGDKSTPARQQKEEPKLLPIVKLDNAETVRSLRYQCHTNTQLTMAQVKACLEAADKGATYHPLLRSSKVQVARKAVVAETKVLPNLAHQEEGKAAPVTKPRQLKEAVRDGESEEWEVEAGPIALFGVLVLLAVILRVGRAVIPSLMRHQRSGKTIRAD